MSVIVVRQVAQVRVAHLRVYFAARRRRFSVVGQRAVNISGRRDHVTEIHRRDCPRLRIVDEEYPTDCRACTAGDVTRN